MSVNRFIKIIGDNGITTTHGYVMSAGGAHIIRIPDNPANRLALHEGVRVVDDLLQPFMVKSVTNSPCWQWLVARCSA